MQADLPFNSKFAFSEKGRDATLEFKDRTMFDFGVAAGLGYNITESFSIDGRATIGLTKINKGKDDKSSFNQYAIGITYTLPPPKPPQSQQPPPPPECPQIPQQQTEEIAEEKLEEAQ